MTGPVRPPVRVIGVTGGIGSGKSTVAARFAERGAEVVDADAIAREVVAPGEPALDAIAVRFGPEVLRPDGSLDRAGLAAIVFAADDARRDLEQITHPHIRARIADRIVAARRREPPPPAVVLDHPLLVETGAVDGVDVVVVVEAPEAVREERLVRRGLDPADARARIAAQASDADRRVAADHVLANDDGREALDAAVDALWDRLVAPG